VIAMSRRNRRSRGPSPPATPAPDNMPPDVPPPPSPPSPPRRSLFRREVERIENEPGFASPGPWSLRGMLTLALLSVLLQIIVGSIAYATVGRGDRTVTYASVLVSVDPVRLMIYALVAMPFARRLAQERRSMRALETLSAGALMYLVYFLSLYVAISLSAHNFDAHDGRQMAGAGAASLLGTAAGAALFPLLYRMLWMPRLPGSRGPGGPQGPGGRRR
jgi:hypothetical protein